MYRDDPKTSGIITAYFITADNATFTQTLQYPPPVFIDLPLNYRFKEDKDGLSIADVHHRRYRLEMYKFSKFGKQTIAIYREIFNKIV